MPMTAAKSSSSAPSLPGAVAGALRLTRSNACMRPRLRMALPTKVTVDTRFLSSSPGEDVGFARLNGALKQLDQLAWEPAWQIEATLPQAQTLQHGPRTRRAGSGTALALVGLKCLGIVHLGLGILGRRSFVRRYSQPRKSLPFGPKAHPATTGSRRGPCHCVFPQGTRLKGQHPKASYLQTIASQTQGHTALHSCKKQIPNYQAEPSISQIRHRHTHHRSIASSSRVHYRSRGF